MSEYKPTYEASHALIVAVEEYMQLPPATTALRCAAAVEQLFQSAFQFTTIKLLGSNATQERILDWFRQLKCGPDDRVIFYFAGHGLTRYAGNRRLGYLALHETNPNDFATSLKFTDILDEASALAAKHVLLIVDAAFGGVSLNTPASLNGSSTGSLETMIASNLRYVITAGESDVPDHLLSPDGNYSAFTHFLLKGLQGASADQDGHLRAAVLGDYLDRSLAGYHDSNQHVLHGYLEGSHIGDFVFREARQQGQATCEVIDDRRLIDDSQDGGIPQALLSHLVKTKRLTILDQITLGQSGSAVYLVGADPHPQYRFDDGLFYCKIYRTEKGVERETHERVITSGLGDYVPKLVDHTPVMNGWMASLYSVAHRRPNSKALSRLLTERIQAAKRTLVLMVDILNKWNNHARTADAGFMEPITALRHPFRPYDAMERVVEPIENFMDGLSHDVQHIQFTSQVLPNPLHYLADWTAWENARAVRVPIGHVHGDLHSNNIICLLQNELDPIPVIIDFDTYDPANNLFFDFAYLEIDLARRLLPPGKTELRTWLRVSDYLAKRIVLDDEPNLGYEIVPLNDLLRPLRAGIDKIASQTFDYEIAYWLARTSAGLSYARKRKVNQADRRLSMLIAAHSLERVLDLLEIDSFPKQQPFWINW